MEEIRALLAPWYLEVKFLHLFMVAMWSFSTVVAYRNYVLPAFLAWQRVPDNPEALSRRNEVMERFDRGVILEHVAFPLVLLSGLLMVWLAGWSWQAFNWLGFKLLIVVLIFLPIEIVDYYISHGAGNKRRIRKAGDTGRYERMIGFHWLFFRVTTPLVVIFVPTVFYLAVTRPL